jgi:lysophospholipase L1-like esterase
MIALSRRKKFAVAIGCASLLLVVGLLQRWEVRAGTTFPFAQAMAPTATSDRSQPKEYRILAYGDSLTAGTSGFEMHPYATYLEQALNLERRQQQDIPSVVVRHRGLPGRTAASMIGDLDGDRTGLRSAIRAVRDPPLSIVILLAGTNDLGHGFGAEEITENILALHKVCYEEGVPSTIAIGIPPSGYQSVNPAASTLAGTVTANLEAFCLKEDKARFHPFPFAFERNGENWYMDTLHFSKRGYQVLGESLVPAVDDMLQSLDK